MAKRREELYEEGNIHGHDIKTELLDHGSLFVMPAGMQQSHSSHP